jgi:hypothetical protein
VIVDVDEPEPSDARHDAAHWALVTALIEVFEAARDKTPPR